MKRILLHVTFWVIYTLQDALFAVAWLGSELGPISNGRLFLEALEDALLCLVSKFIFAYFLLEVSVPRIVAGKYRLSRVIIEAAVVLVFSLFVYRVLAYYVINPIVYGLPNPGGLITVRGVLGAVMDIGFVSGVAVAIKFVEIQVRVKENEKHLIREKLEAELNFLRHQTSPHFLLNTLNNVYALARKKSDDTAEVVMKLSELLRFILYESGDAFIPLTEEIRVLEDYLELERMRYDERLTIRLKKDLDSERYRIAPLLLLPFIENAFKHGISESRFESFVGIDIRVVNGRLTYEVVNSKDGAGKEANGKNIGLANVRRRLELSYREFELDIQEEINSYRVNLVINLESHVEI